MTIEDYVRNQLALRQILIKDVAPVMGYNVQSLRNKLTRHTLSLKDVLILSAIFDKRLIMDAETKEVDNSRPDYVFSLKDYLSDEEMQRLAEFISQLKERDAIPDENEDIESWLSSLPEEKQKELFKGSAPYSSSEHFWQTQARKMQEGISIVHSTNFRNNFQICGENHVQAAIWLSEKNIDATKEQEILNKVACENRFDVFIIFVGKNKYIG